MNVVLTVCIVSRRKAKRNFCSNANQRGLLQSYKLYLVLLVSEWNCGYSPTQYKWVLKRYATIFCVPKCGFMVLRKRFLKSLNCIALGLHSIKWQANYCAHALFIKQHLYNSTDWERETEQAILSSYRIPLDNQGLIAIPSTPPLALYAVCTGGCPGGKAVGAWSLNSLLSKA